MGMRARAAEDTMPMEEETEVDILPIEEDQDDLEILPIDEDPGVDILPIDEDNQDPEVPEVPPVDEGEVGILPGDEEGGETGEGEIPAEEEVNGNRKCAWGPLYYCQSKKIFDECKGSTQSDSAFENECSAIRAGMQRKCEDMGERFWCSNKTNFNYCVASRGFQGNMQDFSACKPERVGQRRDCRNCKRPITRIYNRNGCACPKK